MTTPKSNDEAALPLTDCSACEKLRQEVARLTTENVKLHAECKKYRVALNRIAHPDTWGVRKGHEANIALRALVIGLKVDPLPRGAEISKPNAEAMAREALPSATCSVLNYPETPTAENE